MISNLKYYGWYLFFTIYWTVIELGTRGEPKSNASGFIALFVSLNLAGCLEILLFFGIQVNLWIFVAACFILGNFFSWRCFTWKDKYLTKVEEFRFIKSEVKSKRYIIMIITALQSMAFVAGLATLRNIYDTL